MLPSTFWWLQRSSYLFTRRCPTVVSMSLPSINGTALTLLLDDDASSCLLHKTPVADSFADLQEILYRCPSRRNAASLCLTENFTRMEFSYLWRRFSSNGSSLTTFLAIAMNGEKQDAVCKSNLRAKMSTTVLFVCCSPHSSHPSHRLEHKKTEVGGAVGRGGGAYVGKVTGGCKRHNLYVSSLFHGQVQHEPP